MSITVYFTPKTLITIYDKSELPSVSKSRIIEILKGEGLL